MREKDSGVPQLPQKRRTPPSCTKLAGVPYCERTAVSDAKSQHALEGGWGFGGACLEQQVVVSLNGGPH